MGESDKEEEKAVETSGALKSMDDIEYGLRGVVRLLSRRGNRPGYFFERIMVKFASELGRVVPFESTFLDHENLVIVIELPDPIDESIRESVRGQKNREYTAGADDLKTQAAISAWQRLDFETQVAMISSEKSLANES